MIIRSFCNNSGHVFARRGEPLQDVRSQRGPAATSPGPVASETAARRPSTAQVFPAANLHLQRLVSAQKRLNNFTAATPENKAAMLGAMEPRDAASLLDGLSLTDPNQTADLFFQIKSEDVQRAILGHLSKDGVAAELFDQMGVMAAPEISQAAPSQGQSPSFVSLDRQALADVISDMEGNPKEAAKLLLEQTNLHPSWSKPIIYLRGEILGLVVNEEHRHAIRQEIGHLAR